jgi:hypothetical protein
MSTADGEDEGGSGDRSAMVRTSREGIISALEDARQDLLDYNPPWIESSFEQLRIAIDRKLRSVQLGIVKLSQEEAKPAEVEGT